MNEERIIILEQKVRDLEAKIKELTAPKESKKKSSEE